MGCGGIEETCGVCRQQTCDRGRAVDCRIAVARRDRPFAGLDVRYRRGAEEIDRAFWGQGRRQGIDGAGWGSYWGAPGNSGSRPGVGELSIGRLVDWKIQIAVISQSANLPICQCTYRATAHAIKRSV